MSFSYTPPFTRCADLVANIGINTHLRGGNGALYTNAETVMESLTYLGVSLVRDSMWATGEANQANYTTMAKAGFRFDMLANTNYTPAQMVTSCAAFEAATPGSVAAMEGINEINNYASFSYGGFSGTNASNAGMSQAAAAWQADLDAAAKANSVLASKPVLNFTDFPDTNGACDFGCFHTYPAIDYSPGPVDHMGYQEYTQETAVGGNKPMACTEFNWATTGYAGDIDQATQAKYLLTGVLGMSNNGVSVIIVYEAFDEAAVGTGTKIQDPNFYGLFTSTGVKKLSAVALHNLTRLLRDDDLQATTFTPNLPTVTLSGGPARMESMLLQKANGRTYLAVWNDVRLWANGAAVVVPVSTVTLTLPAAVRRLEVFDPVNGLDPVAYAFNVATITFQLSDRPILIEIQPTPSSAPIADPFFGANDQTWGSSALVFAETT